MSEKRTLARLIEKARRGEDIGIRNETDRLAFTSLGCILADWVRGIGPDDDDIPLMMIALGYAILPKAPGRPRKSARDRQRDMLIKAKARARWQQLRREGVAAKDARLRAVQDMQNRYPHLKRISVKTLQDRLLRR